MSDHGNDSPQTVHDLRSRIEAAIPGALAEVQGSGGHYTITVTAAAFAGRSLIDKQRMVLTAIADLMKGESAPVHAVDRLVTRVPGA